MIPNQDFYFNKEEQVKACLLALRGIILDQDKVISEMKKYGMPCFCYKKKAFVYLWTDKKTKEPYILFVDGKSLNFSELEVGKRAKMKIFRIDSQKDIPLPTLQKLLQAALDLYRT